MTQLRCAMVGGGRDAFIGAVHRHALALDGRWQLVAGALSSTPDKARESGRALGLADERNHGSWQALLDHELTLPAERRVHAVVVVTPNHVHHAVARAFTDAGIPVVCDKPLATNPDDADDLVAAVARAGTVFAVTYNYTGYPMVRQARAMVRAGVLGTLRKVQVEYHQGWLARAVQSKQAGWRTDPAKSGLAGAIGDIGSHAENLVAAVTGLEIEGLCADLASVVADRRVDDDAVVLMRYAGGVRGLLVASQVEAGIENDLRLRVVGSEGTIEWRQEEPNVLLHAPADAPRRVLTRNGPGLDAAARRACRLPSGHPEGFIEAFANLYGGIAEDIAARIEGRPLAVGEGDYPRVDDGARGVRFIARTLASARSTAKWTAWRD